MLSQEEYRAFEQEQSNKFMPADAAPSMRNYEYWQITRYDNNLRRYFITAKHEFGSQYKQYVDRGFWQGGREQENRLYEELQYFYRNTQGVKICRTAVNENCKLYEITEYGTPIQCIMYIDGERKYMSKPHALKDGYRYRMTAI